VASIAGEGGGGRAEEGLGEGGTKPVAGVGMEANGSGEVGSWTDNVALTASELMSLLTGSNVDVCLGRVSKNLFKIY